MTHKCFVGTEPLAGPGGWNDPDLLEVHPRTTGGDAPHSKRSALRRSILDFGSPALGMSYGRVFCGPHPKEGDNLAAMTPQLTLNDTCFVASWEVGNGGMSTAEYRSQFSIWALLKAGAGAENGSHSKRSAALNSRAPTLSFGHAMQPSADHIQIWGTNSPK